MRLIDADKLEAILAERAEELRGIYGDLGGAVSGARKLVRAQETVEIRQAKTYNKQLGGCADMGEGWKKYYTVKPIKKRVSKDEFEQFINSYPRELERNFNGIFEPPAIIFNDFQLARHWAWSAVAHTYAYSGDVPEEKREYLVMENFADVYSSGTKSAE